MRNGSNLYLYRVQYSNSLYTVFAVPRYYIHHFTEFVFARSGPPTPQQQGDQCETNREEPQAAQKKHNGTQEPMTTGGREMW